MRCKPLCIVGAAQWRNPDLDHTPGADAYSCRSGGCAGMQASLLTLERSHSQALSQQSQNTLTAHTLIAACAHPRALTQPVILSKL